MVVREFSLSDDDQVRFKMIIIILRSHHDEIKTLFFLLLGNNYYPHAVEKLLADELSHPN